MNKTKTVISILTLIMIGVVGLSLRPKSEPTRYPSIPEPGQSLDAEHDLLMAMGDYFAIRASYPTGNFDPNWVAEAAATDEMIERALPDGEITYERGRGAVGLDPASFTALGPMPLQTDGCQVCYSFGKVAGRVNVIVSDPVDPTIAYIGSDGGGVWKTTDCCDANTSWSPMMDDPALSSIAIGDLVMDPNDHNTLYAGTGDLRYGSWSFGSYGVLKTTDGGATWTTLGADIFNNVYEPAEGEFPQYQAVGKVRVDPRNSSTVIAGSKTGVHFSYDGGQTWTEACHTNSFLDQRQDTTGMLVADEGTATALYVAIGTRGHNTTVQPDLTNNGANGIYKTTVPESGCPNRWELVTTTSNGWPNGTGGGVGFPDNPLGRIDIAMAPSDNNVIYAQVADPVSRTLLGVWYTEDGGSSWTLGTEFSELLGCDNSSGGQNWYDQGLAVDPNNPDVIFMSIIDAFRSTNGADSFTNVTCGYAGGSGDSVHVDHHALAYVDGDSNKLLVGNDGGVYYTNNAAAADPDDIAYIQLNDTLNTIEFYAGDITMNFANSDAPGINAGAQDNGSMVKVWDDGNPTASEWQMTTGGDGMYARIEPVFEQRWYQESQNGNLKVSLNGPEGQYSLGVINPWTLAGDTLSFIMPYEINRYGACLAGCNKLIVGTDRVWETITGGIANVDWFPNSPVLTKGTLGNRSFIQELTYTMSDDTKAVVGTLDGNYWFGYGLGNPVLQATWVDLTGGNAVLPNRPIMDVGTDPNDPLIGYAALGGFTDNTPEQPGHVYQYTCSADCATFTWVNKSGNLPNVPINAIFANPNRAQQVFAGSDWGLYFTNDITVDNPQWFKFSEGLPSVMIWDMVVDRGFTTLAVFTRSRGAYAWPLPDADIVVTPPTAVTVSQTTAQTTSLVLWLAVPLLLALSAIILKLRRQNRT